MACPSGIGKVTADVLRRLFIRALHIRPEISTKSAADAEVAYLTWSPLFQGIDIPVLK